MVLKDANNANPLEYNGKMKPVVPVNDPGETG